jgi:hypothetical protein
VAPVTRTGFSGINDLRAKNLDFRMAMAPADSTLRENAAPNHKKSEVQAAHFGVEGEAKNFRHLIFP